MGLGSWLNRAYVYDVTSTTDDTFHESHTLLLPSDCGWGFGTSGPYGGAMAIPGVWRAATMRSDLLGKFPWHAYRRRGTERPERISTPPILVQPSPPHTRMTTFTSLGLDLIFHGNAVALVVGRYADQVPSAILPVDASTVSVKRENGRLVYDVAGKRYDQADVLHIMGPTVAGALRGMGVLEAHFATLNLSHELTRKASNVSGAGVPTGLLKSSDPDLDKPAAEELKAGWLTAQRDRTIAVLNAATEFTPLAWNPEEMQLLEARKWSLAECALIMGIPGYWLGAEGPSFTYSSAEWEGSVLLKYTSVGADVERFEQALSGLLPLGTYVKANLDAVLRSATRERYEAHKLGIDAGWLQKSEVRAFEDLPPIDGIDGESEPPEQPQDDTLDPDAEEEPEDNG